MSTEPIDRAGLSGLRHPLSQLLARVERGLSRRIEAVLAPHGLSLDQWRVLTLLADDDGHAMTEIAAHVMVPAPTLTKIVDRLVSATVVHRRVDETDRRRVLVLRTERGAELHDLLALEVEQVENALVAELGTADAATLARLLQRLGG